MGRNDLEPLKEGEHERGDYSPIIYGGGGGWFGGLPLENFERLCVFLMCVFKVWDQNERWGNRKVLG